MTRSKNRIANVFFHALKLAIADKHGGWSDYLYGVMQDYITRGEYREVPIGNTDYLCPICQNTGQYCSNCDKTLEECTCSDETEGWTDCTDLICLAQRGRE